VVQIRHENCISTLWQQENRVASICMWCKSNLKIASKFKGLANFDNSWEKKSRFEQKVKHLKVIDQSSKG
jgi:hypothetical protein